MTLMLDTTALLARYLDGPFRPIVLAAMATDHDWCASALALSEALMLIDQIGDDPDRADHLRRTVRDDWERIHVVPVDQRCLDRASELGRTQPLRTVDALHLAAADRLPRPVRFVTFDPGQIPVAMALGFDVISTEAERPKGF
ncbi:MAG: type II toxin-antitoxin system VapC family toxin [Actinobacteria bacterium]|nr:type II toxin-antitoxin system VapC family toxin [Actinomycetota bacterium]